jgi:hypothetical protein
VRWQPLESAGVHHRGDAKATIEDTMGMHIQRLEGHFQELAGGRSLERGGPCGWVGVQSYPASGLGSFESIGGGEQVSLVQEEKEAQSQGTSLQDTREGRWAGGDPGHSNVQPGFLCLTQPLPLPCVITMWVAESGLFTMENITRERLYLEHHSNKAAYAVGDGGHAWTRTRWGQGGSQI